MHRTEGTNHSSNTFVNGPPSTYVEENWLNAIQEEVAYFIETNGITFKTAGTDTHDQLYAAAQHMIGSNNNYYSCAGTANSIVLTKVSDSQATALYSGMVINFLVALTNTTATAVTVDSFLPKTIKDLNGDDLVGGELIAGEYATAIYSSGSDCFLLVNGAMLFNGANSSGGFEYGGKNLITNGSCNICQHGSTIFSVPDETVLMDNWRYKKNGTMEHNFQMVAITLLTSKTDEAFGHDPYLSLQVADSLIGSSDYCYLETYVEGYDSATLYNKYATLSFWIQTYNAGTYCVSIANNGEDRSFVHEFEMTTTYYEFHQVTFPMTEHGGTWNYYNDTGLKIRFCLAGGSNYQTGTTDSWVTGNYLCTSNQENGVNMTLGHDVRIKNVQLEKGRYFTGYDLISHEREYAKCLRYRYYPPQYGNPWLPGIVNSSTFWVAYSSPTAMIVEGVSFSYFSASPTAYTYIDGSYYGLSFTSIYKNINPGYDYNGNCANYILEFSGKSTFPSGYNSSALILGPGSWSIDATMS